MKMQKPLIDINRLNYLIQRGRDSYSDGREEFEYELLLDLMRRLKVKMYNRDEKNLQQRERHKKAMPWNTTHCWQIQIISKFNCLTNNLKEDEEEPYNAGVHVYGTYYNPKEALKWLRNTRRKENPHEKWSIVLVRKSQPKMPA